MKLHRLVLALAPAVLIAGTASAQTAAATLPNTFDGPAAQGAPVAVPTAPPAEAPDIARAEAALRSVIAAAQGGSIDYSVFTDDLAERMRAQEAQLTPIIQSFGALQGMTHLGQDRGIDLFRVSFANQQTEWLITFAPDDRIAALRFRPAAD